MGGGGITYRVSADSLPGLISDYNVVGALDQSEDTGATETLAQWQAQTGLDAHSFVASPSQLFANAASNDYHLSSTSPAIGAGTSTDAPATDLDGNSRPSGTGYDIGAYEYQSGTIAPAVPATPTNLTATPGNAQVSLSWSAATGATSYNLYRATTSGGEGSTPYRTGLAGTTFTDTGLTNGTTCYYQVTAVNSGGQSGKSSEVSAVPKAAAPAAPATPTNLTATPGNAQVSLSWTRRDRRHQLQPLPGHDQRRRGKHPVPHRPRRHDLHRYRPDQRHHLLLSGHRRQQWRPKRQVQRGLGGAQSGGPGGPGDPDQSHRDTRQCPGVL